MINVATGGLEQVYKRDKNKRRMKMLAIWLVDNQNDISGNDII